MTLVEEIMKVKSLIIALFCLLIAIIPAAAVAQQPTQPSKHMMREDSAAVDALVMYPDTVRLHIFEACEYPAAIVSIGTLQKNSSADFTALISGYSKNEQEDLWNLSRYPDLISKLVRGGKKSEDEINSILIDYPSDIHDIALKYGRDYYDLVQKMDDMLSQTDAQFDQIIQDYPPETQVALNDIIQYPDIVSLLNDHLSLAVRVGDHFRRDPQRVIERADSLNLAETQQNNESADEWKQRIEQNPDEATDLQNAAGDFATENGYTQTDLTTPPDPDEISNYTCHPYSYWFGYPTWYPYSYWYPYPFWFDCGFYHDRHGKVIVFGSPSSAFTNWYFYAPEHWNRYPHLCNAYVDHYYGARRPAGGNTILVHDWVRENRNYLPDDFISNRSRRLDVIKQVGQLNIDVRKQKGGKPVSTAVRDQYFQNNTSKYPSLNRDPKRRMVMPERQPNIQSVIQQPVKEPPVRMPEPPQSSPRRIIDRQKNENQTPVRNPKPEQPVINPRPAPAPPAYNFNNIKKADEYHRNVWEQTQPTARPAPQPAPRPQAQPPVRQQPTRQQPVRQQPVRQQPVKQQPPGKRR